MNSFTKKNTLMMFSLRKTLVAFSFIPSLSLGQNIDYNLIILPSNAKDIQIPERLVQIAWANNPTVQILNHQVKAAEYGKKIAARNFLNTISATGNLTEYNINPPSTSNIYPSFYPRYNFAMSVNLGYIFTDPIKVKRAQEETAIAVENINSRKLALRAEVLRRYQIYETNRRLRDIQASQEVNTRNFYNKAKDKFEKIENATVSEFYEYTSAEENENNKKAQLLVAERELYLSKVDLEELLGVKLEDALGNDN